MHCKICGDWTCEKLSDIHSLVAYGTEEDLDSHFHYHDMNYRYQTWKCSKGHEFDCAAYNACWCGWTSQYPSKGVLMFKEKKSPPTGYKFNQTRVIFNADSIVNLRTVSKEQSPDKKGEKDG